MAGTPIALVAIVQARRGDATLVSLLATAAQRVSAKAEAQASGLRHEARRLRYEAWRDLQSAKSDFDASRQRTMVVPDLEIDVELKAAAVHAASQDLARSRTSLRSAADAVEHAVSAAKLAEAQAEMVLGRALTCPEVAAYEALRGHAGQRHEEGRVFDRNSGRRDSSGARHPQSTAPRPAGICPKASGPGCRDDAAAA